MSENWVVQMIQFGLGTWMNSLNEVWQLIAVSPEQMLDGRFWPVIENIHGGLQAVGYALLVLFFLIGVMKTGGTFAELKRPEHALKLFIRFAIAKGVITYGMELMLALMAIVQGIIATVMNSVGAATGFSTELPEEIVKAIEECNFLESIPLWAVSLIGSLVVWVLSVIVLLSVYGRFFKIYMYTAIAPIPLSAFAGEPMQNVGVSFLKSYGAVCLEGVIIVLSCVIFSLFATTPPVVGEETAAIMKVLKYLCETVFSMLILVGCIKMSDRIVREMMGL